MTQKITVRVGGLVGSTIWDATPQVPTFDVEGGSYPMLDAAHMYGGDGNAAQFEFIVDDDIGEIPRLDLTKNLASHNVVTITEDASGTELWLARGRIADKGWGRGTMVMGDARASKVRVDDGNTDFRGLALVEDWPRGVESGRARVLAALAAFCDGAPRLTTVIATHLVAVGGEVMMPEHTYPAGTELAEIFRDSAEVEGKLWGAVIHHAGGSHLCMEYIDEGDHTTYASTLSITDDDPDLVTAFPPQWLQGDAALESGGDNPISHLVSRWGSEADSFVVATNPTIPDAYDYWAEPYYDSLSESEAEATVRANARAAGRQKEHVTHQPTILIPADKVHLVEAGMSITIKSAASMGGLYLGTTQTRRIAQAKKEFVAPALGSDPGQYLVHLHLDRPEKKIAEHVGSKALATQPKPAGCTSEVCRETFTRTVANSLNPSEIEPIAYAGAAFSVTSDRALMESAAATIRVVDATFNPAAGMPFDLTMQVRYSVITPGSMSSSLLHAVVFNNSGLYTDGVFAGLVFNGDDGTISIRLNGTDFVDVIDPYTASNLLHFRVRFDATSVRAKVWLDTSSEPVAWMAEEDGLDTSLTHMLWFTQGQPDSGVSLAEVEEFVITEGLFCGTCDPVTTVGGTGEGEYAESGGYVPAGSVLEHAHITTGGPYHEAADVTIADAGNDFAATTVEGALDELQADAEADAAGLAAHLADTADAHDASAISVLDTGGNFTGTDVEAVLAELDAAIGGGGHAEDHASRHSNGGADEVSVENLGTAETDTTMVLAPDGAGGVEFRAEAGGGGGSSFYPGGRIEFWDECFFRSATAAYNGGLFQQASGSGAATVKLNSIAGHPGLIQLSTGTTAAGRVALATDSGAGIVLGEGALSFGGVLKLNTLSDGTNTYTARVGFGDSVAGTSPNNGVMFRYTDAVNGGRWEAVCVAAGVETGSAVDTGITADLNYHTYEIVINAGATSVEFFIDGASVATVTANIPTAAATGVNPIPLALIKTAGLTARTAVLDAYWYAMDFTTPR